MESDSAKTMAVLIAVGMVLAGCSAFLVRKPLTEAERILLSSGDIELGWNETDRFSPYYPTNSSFTNNSTSAESVIMSKNTSIIICHLYVFKTSEACLEWFSYLRSLYGAMFMIEDVEIGDMGFKEWFNYSSGSTSLPSPPGSIGYSNLGMNIAFVVSIDNRTFFPNPSNYFGLTFIKGNILASIIVLIQGADAPTQPWLWNFASNIGKAQLQKIDKYASF